MIVLFFMVHFTLKILNKYILLLGIQLSHYVVAHICKFIQRRLLAFYMQMEYCSKKWIGFCGQMDTLYTLLHLSIERMVIFQSFGKN